MTKIALTAAAILIATGTAFAGSDNYGANQQPAANVDHSFTASIQKSDTAQQSGASTKVTTESGQGIWGR